MKLEHSDTNAAQQAGESGQSPQKTRRRLIQTGLAGAPLLMALKSVPALAAECKQPSGFSASGNLSQNGTTPCSPKVNGVAYWQTQVTTDPTKVPDVDKAFSAIFSASPGVTDTLGTILTSTGSPIQKKIVAAYFSASTGSPLFNAAQAVAMWNEGVIGGAFHPNPSVPSVSWGPVEVEAYLNYVLN